MKVEAMKANLLEFVTELQDLNVEDTPSYFFLRQLSAELSNLGESDHYLLLVLGSFQVDLPALGLDYRPHEKWLKDMAKAYAVLIRKVIKSYGVFGEEAIRNHLKHYAKLWFRP